MEGVVLIFLLQKKISFKFGLFYLKLSALMIDETTTNLRQTDIAGLRPWRLVITLFSAGGRRRWRHQAAAVSAWEWPPRELDTLVAFVNDAFNPGRLITFKLSWVFLFPFFFLFVSFWIFNSNSIFRKKTRSCRAFCSAFDQSLKFPTVRLFLVDTLDRMRHE